MDRIGTLAAVCRSEKKGTPKQNVGTARLIEGQGLEGDAHAGCWHRQISLLSVEKVEAFRRKGLEIAPGAFGENLLVRGLDLHALPVGTWLSCGEALLELTQIGKDCHSGCAIQKAVGDCVMPHEGVFAKVLRGGLVSVGDEIAATAPGSSVFRAAVVTLSDRGARGERVDESGPLASELLTRAGYEVVESLLLPDERSEIERALIYLADRRQCHLVVTTGGTGFSPRDVTPEATMAVAERNAPGIAEAIRAYSLQITPRAMLSRGASVIRNGTLIVNLPGSPKAVREALGYILPFLTHGIEILRGNAGDCARSGTG